MAFPSTSGMFSSGASAKSRRGPRVTPDPLLIIRLPTGNHGIVLDLSEQGLGFLAASPIDEGRSIRFVLSDRSNRKSEATGQLMWKDAAGKRCGLQFTEVSQELREMIQSCLGQEDPDVAGSSEPLPPPLEVPDSFPSQAHAGIFGDIPIPGSSQRRGNFVANATTLLAAALIAFAIWYNLGGLHTSISPESVKKHVSSFLFSKVNHTPFGWTTKLKPQHVAPAAKKTEPSPVETASLPAAVSDVVPNTDALPENALTETQPAVSSKNVQPQAASAPVPAPAPVVAPAPITNAPVSAKPTTYPKREKTNPEVIAAQPQPAPIATVPVAPEQPARAANQTAAADDQVTQARKLLSRENNPVDQSKGIQLLWQAVAKGNPSAEVELAGLYLRGRGVSKSCSQALVLLKAAQSKKSSAAVQELSNLPQFGCGAPDESSAANSSPNGAQ